MVTEFSPAKINLFLAVTRRRADGFHDLVSVAATLDFGDEVGAEAGGRVQGAGDGEQDTPRWDGRFTLECDDPAVPVDGSNLVLRAAEAFAAYVRQARGGPFSTKAGGSGADALACNRGDMREHGGGAVPATGAGKPGADGTGFVPPPRVHFRLTKRIPLGAGLGGGSSNGVAALRAMNALGAGRLDEAGLECLAAELGSDCVLFLRGGPVIMRGRGERVAVLPESAALRLRGRRVLLFKPSFAIPTAWAYRRLAERGRDYLAAPEAEARLAAWANGQRPAEELLFNNLEPVAFEKHPALPLLLAKLRREFGVAAGMSGSGSACFALLAGDATDAAVSRMTQRIRECWGPAAWVQAARIA